jgi:hypothetical protein
VTDDPYTMDLELCDAAGVTHLERLNHLRALGGHDRYDGAPFPCTGHAHLAGQHIRCTSPAHVAPAVTFAAAVPTTATVTFAAAIPTTAAATFWPAFHSLDQLKGI